MPEATNACQCGECRKACATKPGWLMPEDVQAMADHLGLTQQELFDRHLAVDWWEAGSDIGHNVFVLAPAIDNDPGDMYPGNPGGRCILYRDNLCGAHPVKPFECREYLHSDAPDQVHARHLAVAKAWDQPEHQQLIEDLLGDKPNTADWDSGGFWGFS